MVSTKALETRRRITDATVQVMLTQGFPQLTLEEVAKQANVSKGGLLYHFSSKEELLMGVIEEQERRQFQQYQTYLGQGFGPMEAFVMLQAQRDEEFCLDIDTVLFLLSLLKENAAFVEERKKQVHQFFDHLMEQADPVEAMMIRFTLDGLKMSEHFQFGQPASDVRQALIERLLKQARKIDQAAK
ncbi:MULTISPECIES: TetR/AcrR family transcriptional regulator [Exiguobacterium]|uniref:Transcriptional regulator, TetR family n=1 Tax=Exiguobacterium sibiricum (strain DSM 17290 / CCUG 55495 / CIP 109462 / JCM 13490 / 255-15) TaxID=262543 RepID=B1YFL8_EXIS2|nr:MULTISPECIES: TetR/AcrR family transcriptional regulator [Exiguobacterium]ACB62343.1 transcriptional regulator, TetR family [Exiguobacterium sibiricum 255-15]MCT4792402.1 TetR/AcrR family transcriptional regulator [Exiguobacterium artemiae]